MRSEEVIDEARRRAGLETFHEESFREGLDLLSENLRRYQNISEGGRRAQHETWIGGLVNRLRVDAYHRDHPELADTPIVRPVFILGMPRTGTTLASNLLDADPARRSLLKWEVPNSAPPAEPGALAADPRCLAMRARDNEMLAHGGMSAFHHEEADGPTECTFLHAHDFKSCFLESLSPTPDYSRWLLGAADLTSAYRYQKRTLQVLQSTNGGTWALKMPSHALFVRGLLEVFPDARLVWTHRDPFKAMGSFCSLIYNAQTMANTNITREGVRDFCIRQGLEHLRRPMELDAERPGFIHHLHYDRMVSDPVGAMRDLHAELGDEFTPETEAGILRWLAANPQGRFGKHAYGLEEYGLSVDSLQPRFADYLARYDVAREG